jgi:hypothetical protein
MLAFIRILQHLTNTFGLDICSFETFRCQYRGIMHAETQLQPYMLGWSCFGIPLRKDKCSIQIIRYCII